MTWDYRSVYVTQEVPGTSQDFHSLGLQECSYVTRGDTQEAPGTSQDFHDLGLQECSYVTRGAIPGSPRDIPGLSQPGTTGV